MHDSISILKLFWRPGPHEHAVYCRTGELASQKDSAAIIERLYNYIRVSMPILAVKTKSIEVPV